MPEESKDKYETLSSAGEVKSKSREEGRQRNNSDFSDNDAAKKSKLIDISENEIQEASDEVTKEEDEMEVLNEIFPISLKMFWENFFSDNAKFSFADHLEENKEKEIKLDMWHKQNCNPDQGSGEQKEANNSENEKEISKEELKVDEKKDNLEAKISDDEEKFRRELNFIAKVKGVPFLSSSK